MEFNEVVEWNCGDGGQEVGAWVVNVSIIIINSVLESYAKPCASSGAVHQFRID